MAVRARDKSTEASPGCTADLRQDAVTALAITRVLPLKALVFRRRTTQADAIANDINLRLRFTSGGSVAAPSGNRRTVHISWAELQVPAAGTAVVVPLATATGRAFVPTVAVAAVTPAAAVSGIALAPSVQTRYGAPVATATGSGSASQLTPAPTQGAATQAGLAPTLALPIPAAGVSALALAPSLVVRLSVPVAQATGVALDPALVLAGETIVDVPLATGAVTAPTPAPTVMVGVPAATVTTTAHVPLITPQVTTSQGSVTGSGLVPSLALSVPASSVTGAAVAPTLMQVFPVVVPVASGTSQGRAPALQDQVFAPTAGATLVASTPTPSITVAVPRATSALVAIAPTMPVAGIVNTTPSFHGLTFGGGTTIMQAAVISSTVVGVLTLGSTPATISFGHTVQTTPGEIVLSGGRTRLSKDGDDELRVIARFDADDTGQEMVTIENEATGENWTRPSKVMLIYQMGYGERWRQARDRRFGRSLSPLRPAGWSELALNRRLVTRRGPHFDRGGARGGVWS